MSYDNLGIAPAFQMKMMMDGRTPKKPFSASIFEIAILQNQAAQFDDKYAAAD